MSVAYPNCSSETCFPADCEHASKQAEIIVAKGKEQLAAGLSIDEVIDCACAEAAASMERAMESLGEGTVSP